MRCDTQLNQFIDRLYMSTTTMTTVGFGDIVPVSTGAKVLVMLYSWVGYSLILSVVVRI